MKKSSWKHYCPILVLIYSLSNLAIADCSLPCGISEILDCAAAAQPIPLASGKELYNTKLFHADPGLPMLDGLCQLPEAELPSGVLDSNLQKIYYYPPTHVPAGQGYCLNSNASYPYFSYEAFTSAATIMASKAGSDGVLACTGSLKDRYIELISLLATYAQETSGGTPDLKTGACIPPCTGGFFWRYEDGAIAEGNDLSYQTSYYNGPAKNQYFVAASQVAGSSILTQQTYTPMLWYANSIDPSQNGGSRNKLDISPMQIAFYFDSTNAEITSYAPVGNQLTVPLQDPSVLYPGLWVGMGPTQLTAESMYFFYGWYNNIIRSPAAPTANYYSFVNQYVTDGQLGFLGAYWYWMYRKNGWNYLTIHQVLTNTDPTKQVCHGIGAATYLTNGGCNDFSGRKSYYDYFSSILDPTGSIGVDTPYIYGNYNSMDCAGVGPYCQLTTLR